MMILQNAFSDAFVAAGGPKEAAMFARQSEDFKHHHFYFSPGAHLIVPSLLHVYEAVLCEIPPRGGTRLCAGHSGVRDSLLRDKETD